MFDKHITSQDDYIYKSPPPKGRMLVGPANTSVALVNILIRIKTISTMSKCTFCVGLLVNTYNIDTR